MRQRMAAEAERLASRDQNLTGTEHLSSCIHIEPLFCLHSRLPSSAGFFMMTETWILDRLEGYVHAAWCPSILC